MHGTTEATPCPGNYHSSLRKSLISSNGNDTTEIDFTTEFRHSLRAAAPRRRQTNIRARPASERGFTIHEDEEAQRFPDRKTLVGGQFARKSSIMAQPAQRFKPRVSFMPGIEENQSIAETLHKPQSPAPSRTTHVPPNNVRDDGLKRPARRGTIYVPSDDTTMPTMFMGVFSPIKNFPLHQKPQQNQEAVEVTGIAAQMAQKRGPRKSLAAAPPKRAPLQNPLRPVQVMVGGDDIPGRKTGKENIPPGFEDDDGQGSQKKTKDLEDLFDIGKQNRATQRQSLMRPPDRARRASLAETSNRHIDRSSRSLIKTSSTCAVPRRSIAPFASQACPPSTDDMAANVFLTKSASTATVSQTQWRGNDQGVVATKSTTEKRPKNPPMKLTIPMVGTNYKQHVYPRINEDILDTSMYEDNWLSHQEVAITQLVNNLFVRSNSLEKRQGRLLRLDLFELYQSESFSLLHKRLQASVLYGALGIPKDLLGKASKVKDDLGVRKAFLDLWLKTYQPLYLKTAAEVVIGRQCPGTPSSSPRNMNTASSPAGPRSPRLNRQTLSTFLETFLIRNEDAAPPSSQAAAWSYRRILQRSLLLIRLLDVAKRTDGLLPLPLFLASSPHKSSTDVLQALASMLLPSVGDICRPLLHLDYVVSHVQYPLEEYKYTIDNLAIDLRDGVRLTRLVELLLYPSSSQLLDRVGDTDATTTIAMPTGEILSLVEGEHDWPLSQHLRFPCLGRAPKTFNVQIALSALAGVRGIGAIVEGITAEDIVDGYREKTVKLLWGLVGKWGMEGLIDFEDLKSEVQRHRRRNARYFANEEDPEDDDVEDLEGLLKHRHVLKSWASAISLPRGIPVDNLSTSFSDGRIFSAIVDAYASFFSGATRIRLDQNVNLDSRLQILGCNAQFSSLFSSNGMRVFDRDTTLAALAFLASRLLGTSRRARAATTLQRSWRRIVAQREMKKRIVCRRLAKECAMVVRMKERVCWAKGVLWKAWQAYIARRRSKSDPAPYGAGREETGDIWLQL